jgi:hypothetical protein
MQAARVRNYCAAQKCPDKCFNAVAYNTNVCLANPLSIGTNCCDKFKVYFDRVAAASQATYRVPLTNTSVDATIYGHTNQTVTKFYSDEACTDHIGTISFSFQALYDTPFLVSTGTTVYTYAGYAQVTANVTFSWVDYSVAPASGNFKASLDLRLSYYQQTNISTGYLGSILTGKSYNTNGQLLNKKASFLFQTLANPQYQSITFQLSNSV